MTDTPNAVVRIDKETLFVEKHLTERYAVVTFNRPDQLNAASPALFAELANVMNGFEDDDEVRAVVIAGGEGRAFSAGTDIHGMTFENLGSCRSFIRHLYRCFEAVERLPKVVIGAINGYAFGFGCELAVACDLVLASDRATFSLREMNHGFVPSVTVTRGIDVVGRRRVAWMAYTSDDLSAAEAREFGLVNKVVPHDELVTAYTDLAVKMARRAPLAVAATKAVLNKNESAHYLEGENFLPAIFATKDVAEGRRAFDERRAPVFSGE